MKQMVPHRLAALALVAWLGLNALASDALAANGIDPTSLPDYINSENPGVIAVLESQSTGYLYYKP